MISTHKSMEKTVEARKYSDSTCRDERSSTGKERPKQQHQIGSNECHSYTYTNVWLCGMESTRTTTITSAGHTIENVKRIIIEQIG